MHRRTVLSTLCAAPGILRAQKRKPNLLLAIGDDLGLMTGAYEDRFAQTPNLDRLAAEGVRFSHAFCTTASCSASRSVMLTGLQNHASGQYGHAHDFHNFGLLPKVQPLPALLKGAGYRTAVIGKFHVNPAPRFQWDLQAEAAGRSVQEMAATARKFLRDAGSQPWYMHYGFQEPHRMGKGFGNERPLAGYQRKQYDPREVPVPAFLPDNPAVRGEMAEYYAAVHRMDYGFGLLYEELKAAGQLENTIIVFIGDNGIPFPNAKTTCYDAGLQLPLIVRHPDGSKRGTVNPAMVSWTDLTPTFLDAAGVTAPYALHGRSVLPVLDESAPRGWDQVFFSHTFHELTMYYPMRGTRTRQYKYIRNLYPELEYPHASDLWASPTWQSVRGDKGKWLGKRTVKDYLHRPAEELYDVVADPLEVKNLAGTAAHAGTLTQLRKQTQEFRRRTNDGWLINDREGAFATV